MNIWVLYKAIVVCLHREKKGFAGIAMVKKSPANADDAGSIAGSGRCLGEENGNPLQYSCLENSMDRGAW